MGYLRFGRSAFSYVVRFIRHAASPVNYFRSIGATLGSNVEFIGSNMNTLGSEPYLIEIGSGTTISAEVMFVNHDGGLRVVRGEHPEAFHFAPIKIGANCFIGARSIIMPGVTIGDNCVIGAGSVVTSSLASGWVAAGVPARKIKTIDEYWESAKSQLVNPPDNAEPMKRNFLLQHFGRNAHPE